MYGKLNMKSKAGPSWKNSGHGVKYVVMMQRSLSTAFTWCAIVRRRWRTSAETFRKRFPRRSESILNAQGDGCSPIAAGSQRKIDAPLFQPAFAGVRPQGSLLRLHGRTQPQGSRTPARLMAGGLRPAESPRV